MKQESLSANSFETASDYVLHSARALERNTYNHYFNGESREAIVTELANYQNPDGGFGHGIEPDLRLPISSPISTAVAFQHIESFPEVDNDNLVKKGVNYFEDSFNPELERWFAVPREVNEYPHAPWWNYDDGEGMTVIDNYWGNPTAEIIAYLVEYEDFVKNLEPDHLVNLAIEKFKAKQEYESEHEVYCYLRLFRVISSSKKSELEPYLTKAVDSLVRTNPEEWSNYGPSPLHFVNRPDSPRFGLDDELIEKNLNYLIDTLEEEGVIRPNWEWGQYQSEWERAEKEWTGLLTLKALITLDKFGRIDHR